MRLRREGGASALATARSRTLASRALRNYATLMALVVISLMFGILRPQVFFTLGNVRNILTASAILAVVSLSQTIVMAVGDFDLSLGNLVSFSSVVVAQLMILAGLPSIWAVIIALAIGAAVGAINGLLVAYLNLSAFVATLGTMTSLDGAAWRVSRGTVTHGVNEAFMAIGGSRIGGMPVSVIICLVVLLIGYLVLERTTLGRRWYAIGGNREASYLSGIRVRYLRFMAFVVAGLLAGLGAILVIGRLASASPSSGSIYTLTSLAAGFLGMTAFRDGRPNVAGTFVGVLILGVLSNGLDLLNVNTYVKGIVTGAVVIAAVAAAGVSRRRGV